MGLSPQQVADGTMLPLEEVEKLADEIKKIRLTPDCRSVVGAFLFFDMLNAGLISLF